MQYEFRQYGEKLLEMNPDPVPKFLILRDVLKVSPTDPLLVKAHSNLLQSKWIKELSVEQWENGSWGRFHTQDTKIKQKIITTEWAIMRGLELGLSKEDEIFEKTILHMEQMLKGVELPLDKEEHHYGFRIALSYIIASNLSKIEPMNPLLVEKRRYCAECVAEAFQSGHYNEEDWKKACWDRNEVMLNLFMIHPLSILQSGEGSILSDDLERKLLDYIWNRAEGIYYITNHCPGDYQDISVGSFHYWLQSIELLSNFKHWHEYAAGAINHLLNQRGEDGLWDYGPKANQITFGHYSETWRGKENRKIDCSTRVLALLRKYSDKCS